MKCVSLFLQCRRPFQPKNFADVVQHVMAGGLKGARTPREGLSRSSSRRSDAVTVPENPAYAPSKAASSGLLARLRSHPAAQYVLRTYGEIQRRNQCINSAFRIKLLAMSSMNVIWLGIYGFYSIHVWQVKSGRIQPSETVWLGLCTWELLLLTMLSIAMLLQMLFHYSRLVNTLRIVACISCRIGLLMAIVSSGEQVGCQTSPLRFALPCFYSAVFSSLLFFTMQHTCNYAPLLQQQLFAILVWQVYFMGCLLIS